MDQKCRDQFEVFEFGIRQDEKDEISFPSEDEEMTVSFTPFVTMCRQTASLSIHQLHKASTIELGGKRFWILSLYYDKVQFDEKLICEDESPQCISNSVSNIRCASPSIHRLS